MYVWKYVNIFMSCLTTVMQSTLMPTAYWAAKNLTIYAVLRALFFMTILKSNTFNPSCIENLIVFKAANRYPIQECKWLS